MIRVRHEEYDSFTGALPFSLGLNLERTPHNCSQEQNWHENFKLQHITYGNGTVLLDGKAYSVSPVTSVLSIQMRFIIPTRTRSFGTTV